MTDTAEVEILPPSEGDSGNAMPDTEIAQSGSAYPPSRLAGLRPWQPGQSGNPGGKGGNYKVVLRLARDYSPQAMERLIELSGSRDERVAFTASKEILERAYGKVKETAESEVPDRIAPDLSSLSPRQLEALKDAMATIRIATAAAAAGVTVVEADKAGE